ncbi:MAG: hypothetical protein GF346_09435 [Candidatus Eisenbacteria bacterium]|nr:hypothetical protein [Candidatus Latescibacterota bacterium]MBD3302654.1 hypothetical protein [Candidatus Eisenbacteria bacterium]
MTTKPMMRAFRRYGGNAGSSLLIAMLILGALSMLGASIAVVSMSDRNLSRYERHSVEALAAAETGVAFAKRSIKDMVAPMGDEDEDGRPDFRLNDTLSWGGSYEVIAEASDIKGLGITAYQSNGFTIVSEGRFRGAARRVKSEIVHDSFLKYARFVSNTSLTYACDANITGEVFANGDLNIPCGCGGGSDCTFLEMVSVTGDIPNAACGNFHRGYVTDAEPIDLENSFDWTDVRNKARGLGPDNACENKGSIGIYIDLPWTDPLGLAGQPGADNNVLVFENFDFQDLVTAPPDTVVRYGGDLVINPNTGQALRYSEFNGIIFFEGDGYVRGEMDGISAHSVTVYATDDVFVRNHVITGHTGYDPATRLPNQSGDPVNIGLVANDRIYIHRYTPRVVRIDAMFLSRTDTWQALGSVGDHPVAPGGPLDLDLDGIFGETPVNNDPVAGAGWDEMNITADTWVLNISGGIITVGGGSAYPWNDGNVLANADGPTRRYNYDMDMTSYPPPCFPVPLNLYKDVSWTEIFDVRAPLADFLPN